MNEDNLIPKVSILIPIYNVEKYLKECLDSVVNQTLRDIEIICINDGSTDSSPQIIEEYAKNDARIKIINKQNSGYGDSMNKGLELASGEYIGIVESDDIADKNMFEDLYKLAQKDDLDVVKSDFYYYFSKDNQSRHAGRINIKNTGKIFNIEDDASIVKMMPSIWTSIYKNEFLKENEIKFLPTPGASYQDTAFAFKVLVSAKKMRFVNKAYLYYRQDNEASSVKSKGKVYAICDEWNEITKFLDERPAIKKVVNAEKLITQFKAYRHNTMRISQEFRKEFVDVFAKTFEEFKNKNELDLSKFRLSDKKDLKLLFEDKQSYIKYIESRVFKNEQKAKRKKLFSIKISLSRISIILFGKQIIEIG